MSSCCVTCWTDDATAAPLKIKGSGLNLNFKVFKNWLLWGFRRFLMVRRMKWQKSVPFSLFQVTFEWCRTRLHFRNLIFYIKFKRKTSSSLSSSVPPSLESWNQPELEVSSSLFDLLGDLDVSNFLKGKKKMCCLYGEKEAEAGGEDNYFNLCTLKVKFTHSKSSEKNPGMQENLVTGSSSDSVCFYSP